MTLKLHLGCGQNYLKGYLNVDYPLSKHTVQESSVADLYADITKLSYLKGEVAEIRLHHVFEHFRRPQAAAMMAAWNFWMHSGGELHIEVPDLRKMALVFSSPFSTIRSKALAERHLFGSHEASWAAHFEAYDTDIMKLLLESFGFKVTKIRSTYWRGIWNLHVHAKKNEEILTKQKALDAASRYFRHFLVDNSEGELRMLNVWISAFESQFNVGLLAQDIA